MVPLVVGLRRRDTNSKRDAGSVNSMTEACVAITRGGVTYQIPRSEPAQAHPAVRLLHVADPEYTLDDRRSAENGNAESPSRGSAALARLKSVLDLRDPDDLRAAAILAVLSVGIRKNELIALDFSDLSDSGGALELRIRRAHVKSRVRERSVVLTAEAASLLRRYWLRQRTSRHAQALTEQDARQGSEAQPLFWTLGRHGLCRRTRITGHAVNYWLEQLRRRGGFDERLTARSLIKPARVVLR